VPDADASVYARLKFQDCWSPASGCPPNLSLLWVFVHLYTVLTRSVWEQLGLEPLGEMEFVLADGTTLRRAVSEALLELPGYGERHTPVVLGESEDENLLGVVTLEIFGLVLDPFKRILRPMRAVMK